MSTLSNILTVTATIIAVGGIYCAGYYEGRTDAKYQALQERTLAVNNAIETERQKQNEVQALNKSLSIDNANLNRLLRTKSKPPADYVSCVRERNRLRYVVKQLSMCNEQCSESLRYAEIWLR